MCVCVCVCMSDFQRLKPRKLINGLRYQYEIWYASEAITTLKQLRPFNRDDFHAH